MVNHLTQDRAARSVRGEGRARGETRLARPVGEDHERGSRARG